MEGSCKINSCVGREFAEALGENFPWLTRSWRLQTGVIAQQRNIASLGQPAQDIAQ
jgi:hypothetical protein